MYKYALVISLIILACSCQNKETDATTQQAKTAMPYYQEAHRPQFHFTPEANWMNDPNGMVYYDGEYHLFYQYYPDSTVWGPMHWGHAVSTDLTHWEHLPIGLYPDSLGYIFSGSAVVDWDNTSGLGKNGQPPMIAIFTHHDPIGEKEGRIDFQYQSIAYSNDKGRTWTKYEGNPVVSNPGIRDFRDPKVIWDAASEQWIMVFAAWDHVKFYGSKNLIDWQHLSDFGKEWGTHAGVWECPDLFPMQVEGTNEQKWVLLVSINPGAFNGGSGTQYFVGHFDGQGFSLDEEFSRAFGKEEAYIPEGDIFMDFETGAYQAWKTEGEAFGDKPVKGAFVNQQEIVGYTGQYLVNSFYNGDASEGKLISPNFIIEKDYINFKIGGGNDKLRTSINLVVDGKTLRNAAGGNKEKLIWKGWNVAELKGKEARIEIIDSHTGGWGHINVDQIMFADELAKPAREKTVWLDYGRDNYAGVTWSDIPEEDGRRIFMGWMSNWDYAQVVPTEKWRSAMTLPRTLSLKPTENGLRLFTHIVTKLQSIRNNAVDIPAQTIEGSTNLTDAPFENSCIEIELIIEPEANADFGLSLNNSLGETYRLGYDAQKQCFYSDRTQSGKTEFSSVFAEKRHIAPRSSQNEAISLHLFIDKASAELFADDGQTVITDVFFPTEDYSSIQLYSSNGKTTIQSGTMYGLNGIWKAK